MRGFVDLSCSNTESGLEDPEKVGGDGGVEVGGEGGVLADLLLEDLAGALLVGEVSGAAGAVVVGEYHVPAVGGGAGDGGLEAAVSEKWMKGH